MYRMILASLGVALALLIAPAGAPNPAHAVTVDINIGIGTNLSSGRRISCSRGEQLLRNRGFRDVRRIDCRGRHYVYRAWRRGNRYEIALRSRDGRVVDYRRIRR